jgi:hypothetical protein
MRSIYCRNLNYSPQATFRCLCPSLARATLYTHLFKTVMMINRQTDGLKGQLNLAQGNPGLPGNALGWGSGEKSSARKCSVMSNSIFGRNGIYLIP